MRTDQPHPNYLIWVLQGDREGDNAQARALAQRLGAPFVLKRMVWSSLRYLPNALVGAGLAAIDKERSDGLTPPWPDAVIAVGRRSAPVAVWIKRQSENHTRLIHLGRPRFPLDQFDLVITTSQYALPGDSNVIKALLPITAASEVPDRAMWQKRFEHLPRPWTGVLVGGASFPFRFGQAEAVAFAKGLKTFHSDMSGSLLVSTSPRTPKEAVAALTRALGSEHHVHSWTRTGANPHRFILGEADRFIVTEDSVSMLAEACRTRKPVDIWQLPRSPFSFTWDSETGVAAWLARYGLLSSPRNTRRVCDRLVRRGHAGLLGRPGNSPFVPYDDEWDAIARRIGILLSRRHTANETAW
jgi:mitochondrial fission protein ELM1